MSGRLTLILGGARSGKSAWAERKARESGRLVTFIATATAGDAEMADRIAAHQAVRPDEWRTVEAPLDLAGAIRVHAGPGDLVLVDCLTLWVSNLILERVGQAGLDDDLPPSTRSAVEEPIVGATRAALDAARASQAFCLFISNEVGLGIVPPYPLGRLFRDVLGRVNQIVAGEADAVILLIAGLPVDLRRLVVEFADAR